MTLWRSLLVDPAALLPCEDPAVDPWGWPGYVDRAAVRFGRVELAGHPVVLAGWDFAVLGGSFGQRDATAFCAAADLAVAERLPLVSVTASGGTRLQEGVVALVGMARATAALQRLAAAGLPHLSVCDHPTTGGVWVTVGSQGDLRAGVAGATLAFAGPRVAEAVTGAPLDDGSHTAEAALAAGALDAVLEPDQVLGWLDRCLSAVSGRHPGGRDQINPSSGRLPSTNLPDGGHAGADGGWAQVLRSRGGSRPSAREYAAGLLDSAVELQAPHGDRTAWAALGQLAGRGVVAVALAAERAQRPTPDAYRLVVRAARLADRLGLALLTVVDTPGAEPGTAAEHDGIGPVIGEAFAAVLACRSPSVGVLLGEGGSGGALAALVCDEVWAGPDSYLAALGPEGAAAAMRQDASVLMDQMGVAPADLLRCGLLTGALPSLPGAAWWRARLDGARPRDWSTPLEGTAPEGTRPEATRPEATGLGDTT